MIEVRYSDRLGNWLFQYCLGRIIASRLGYSLSAKAIEGFPNTRHAVVGARHEGPVDRYTGHAIPLESILLDPRPRRVLLDGWFQNYRYYRPHVAEMRAWLAWEAAGKGSNVPLLDDDDHRDDLLLHVRLGDLREKRQALSIDFYKAFLHRLPHRRAYLAAEDTTDAALAPLLRLGVRPLPSHLGPLGTLRASGRFGKLVIGQATFGWWMAFLGPDVREVHVGLPEHRGLGSASVSRLADGLDLRIDEARYSYYYRAPLIGQTHGGQTLELHDFCGAHQRSKAYQWI